MKITELDKIRDEAAAKCEALEREISALRHKGEELLDKAARQAAAGNTAEYKATRAAIVDNETEIYVKQQQIKAAQDPFAGVDLVAAWKDYAAGRDKDFSKMFAEYEKHRAALCCEFKALCEYQRETLKHQTTCATCAGYDVRGLDHSYRSIFAFKKIPKLTGRGDEVAYFRACGLLDAPAPLTADPFAAILNETYDSGRIS